jgi:hypothetical protein
MHCPLTCGMYIEAVMLRRIGTGYCPSHSAAVSSRYYDLVLRLTATAPQWLSQIYKRFDQEGLAARAAMHTDHPLHPKPIPQDDLLLDESDIPPINESFPEFPVSYLNHCRCLLTVQKQVERHTSLRVLHNSGYSRRLGQQNVLNTVDATPTVRDAKVCITCVAHPYFWHMITRILPNLESEAENTLM